MNDHGDAESRTADTRPRPRPTLAMLSGAGVLVVVAAVGASLLGGSPAAPPAPAPSPTAAAATPSPSPSAEPSDSPTPPPMPWPTEEDGTAAEPSARSTPPAGKQATKPAAARTTASPGPHIPSNIPIPEPTSCPPGQVLLHVGRAYCGIMASPSPIPPTFASHSPTP
ncbi:hypothetical protein [Kitasatospora cinereorecta]|uniref:hypothetical protein n=1 Tax=Kitasatospora cinereorecta TaxID=285560 RepID=UPI0031F750DB